MGKKRRKRTAAEKVAQEIRATLNAARKAKAGGTVRVGGNRESLQSYLSHQFEFPTIDRLYLAATGCPLPSEECQCDRCRRKRLQGWPAGGYRWPMALSESYECGLHEQSEWFLHNLPSSHSIVAMKAPNN